jgi:hypothetical protein
MERIEILLGRSRSLYAYAITRRELKRRRDDPHERHDDEGKSDDGDERLDDRETSAERKGTNTDFASVYTLYHEGEQTTAFLNADP